MRVAVNQDQFFAVWYNYRDKAIFTRCQAEKIMAFYRGKPFGIGYQPDKPLTQSFYPRLYRYPAGTQPYIKWVGVPGYESVVWTAHPHTDR